MKSAMASIFIFILLLALEATVSARPFEDSNLLAKRTAVPLERLINTRDLDERSHWLAERDSPNFEPEALINTPFLVDENEPIKRNDGDFESEAMINTPFLVDENEPIKRNDGDFEPEAMINTPPLIDNNTPAKRENGGFKPETMINTPLFPEIDENEPIKREKIDYGYETTIKRRKAQSSDDREKRRTLPNINAISYATSEKADGSDDLFEGIQGDPPQYWDTDYGN